MSSTYQAVDKTNVVVSPPHDTRKAQIETDVKATSIRCQKKVYSN